MNYLKLNTDTWKELDDSGNLVSGYKSIWLSKNDNESSILHLFKDEAQKTIATLFNLPCHSVTIYPHHKGISADWSGSDAKTLFPLQAALGYAAAGNLFPTKRNLLVEGPAELVYLTIFSAAIEKAGRGGLRDDISVVPAGGLAKVATFVALQGDGPRELVVIHDWAGKPDPRLDTAADGKLIRPKFVLNYGQFRDAKAKAKGPAVTPPPTDIEDLFAVAFYLKLFNAAFADKLPREVKETDLPAGDRIVERLAGYLADNEIALRPAGVNRSLDPATPASPAAWSSMGQANAFMARSDAGSCPYSQRSASV